MQLGGKHSTRRSPTSRNVEELPRPGSPEARSLGCICSPQQNRSGAGINRFGRTKFFTLYWCPVHGVDALIEALRSDEALRPDHSDSQT
jgi:hypothetical protein